MNLFGKAKKQAPTPKDSIVGLRETLDMLEKRERFLQTKIDNEVKLAKANVTKNKKGTFIFFWLGDLNVQ
jgi:charged multivesicular body protein 4